MRKYHQTYDDDSTFWYDLEQNLPSIRQLDFYGGEPFMSKKMWKTLQLAVDKGYSKDIEVHYATNGTHWPEDSVGALLHFKHLNLNFSIDGTGDQFEYMRYPAVWTEVQENMAKAIEFSKIAPIISIKRPRGPWTKSPIKPCIFSTFSVSNVAKAAPIPPNAAAIAVNEPATDCNGPAIAVRF